MNRSTFEIISKYISHSNGAKVVFDVDNDGGYTDMSNKTIHLPKTIGSKNVFAILALLMHESAHVKYSKQALDKCVDKGDSTGLHIFNCIEDIRIDQKNFRKLSNVREFYERLIRDHCDYSKNTDPKIDFQIQILITAMMNIQNFDQYGFKMDPAVQEFLDDNPLEQLILEGGSFINNKDWANTRRIIQEIKDLLKMAQQQQQQKGGAQATQGDPGDDPLQGIEKLLQPDSIFSDKGTALKGGSASQVGEVGLEEKTVNEFKELLNIKKKKTVEDGSVLDVDNLIAYYTGDIEELFKEEVFVNHKLSKIMFLLDGSGSMTDKLLDGQTKINVVAKCTRRIIRILKEVQEIEGLNVDWDIMVFRSSCQKLKKDTWEKDYYAGGGTNLSRAFDEAVDTLKKDYSVDGKKIIIVLTDGEVDEGQINQMKKAVITQDSDVKSLIIGIGTEPTSMMAEKIIGDHLILAEENANIVILETIKELL